MQPCQWWAEFASPGWKRVKVSENLGATAVTPVAPVDTSLDSSDEFELEFSGSSEPEL